MLIDTQQVWDSDSTAICFFFHLQVSHQQVQPNTPFRGIDSAARFTGAAPAGWPLRAGCQNRFWQLDCCLWTYMPGICYFSEQQSFSCTTLGFALPKVTRLLFDCGIAWYLCGITTTDLLIVSIRQYALQLKTASIGVLYSKTCSKNSRGKKPQKNQLRAEYKNVSML